MIGDRIVNFVCLEIFNVDDSNMLLHDREIFGWIRGVSQVSAPFKRIKP